MIKSVHHLLLEAIKGRKSTFSEFNSGILVAAQYVKTLTTCVGSDLCDRHGSTKDQSFADALKAAEEILTYNNPEMVVVDIYADAKKEFENDNDIELPKNTLMVFKHTLTTPRKDRDGDIMRTEGAKVDPKMLLLWQHVHTLPIGKMLKVATHNAKRLDVVSAIVDINELAHDAAVMIDNKMGRFSHGFRALSFCDVKEEEGRTSAGGFDVKEFEIMEESLVSVPANPDAEQQEILLDLIGSDKLTSSMMKSFGNRLKAAKKTTTVAGGFVEKKDGQQETQTSCGCKGNKGGSGATSSTPEKTNETGIILPEGDANPEGVKSVKVGVASDVKSFYGPLPNSWEDTQEALRKNCRSYLTEKGIITKETDENGDRSYSYSWILGTDSSKCVVCLECRDATKYYQVAWEKNSVTGVAEFIGQPKEVMIKVSAEVLEKSKSVSLIGSKSMKAGKTISASTLETIKEIEADLIEIHEHCSTRSGKALCVKAAGSVKTLITQAEAAKPPEGELKPTPGGEGLLSMQAAATFLAKSTDEERAKVFAILDAQCKIDAQKKVTESVRHAVLN